MFTAVGGIASAAFAGLFLLLPEQTGMRMLPHFVSFATGALIGAALLGLLPEAMEAVGPGGAHSIGIALVAGLGVFFIIEKLVLWRHAHSHEHEDPVVREVVAHGATDALSHDDSEGHARPAQEFSAASPTAVAAPRTTAAMAGHAGAPAPVPVPRTAMAFAGGVIGHGDASVAELHSHGHAGNDHDHGHASATGQHRLVHERSHGGHSGHEHGHSDDRGGHEPARPQSHEPARPQASGFDAPRHDHSHGDRASARSQASGFDAHGHSHGGHGHDHNGAAGVLVLIGDSIHNALDGILIAAAFLTSVPLGLVTTLAVAAHEIPHRVGDFALLLHAGMSRQRAMFLNMATGLASVLGGIVAYFGLNQAQQALPYALALAAAGFLYIAVAGLIPGLHRRADPRTSLAQVLLMGTGVAIIAVAESLTRH
jgi:zinc transporter ZupT